MEAEPTLLLDGLLGAATAAAFVYTGHAISRRSVEPAARLAARSFVAWWHGAAIVNGLLSLVRILAGVGALTVELLESTLYVLLLPLCVALAGLVHYLGFVATGWRRLHLVVAPAYALAYAALVTALASWDPVGAATFPWSLRIEYANPPGAASLAMVVAIVFAPPLAAVAAYLWLYRRVDAPMHRYRLAVVSASVLVLLLGGLAASELGLPRLEWAHPLNAAIGLVASLGILFAYVPPAWVRRRFLVDAVLDERQGAS